MLMWKAYSHFQYRFLIKLVIKFLYYFSKSFLAKYISCQAAGKKSLLERMHLF